MSPVALFLITIAAIFMIGTLGEIVFRRTQIPDVVWLLLVGIILGPVAGVVSRAQLGAIAPFFGALTLVVVLFDGGSRLVLAEISKAAPRSSLLALLTFSSAVAVVTLVAQAVAAIGWLPGSWTLRHSILLGCILGGSSSIIIMPAMTLARVRGAIANLVNLESAFTDAFCVVGAAAMIDLILRAAAGDTGGASPGAALARSFGVGTGIGLVSGFAWLLFLRLLKVSEHAYPITLSALLLLYVAIDQSGGSAALGILAFAVVVGNATMIWAKLGFSETLDLGTDVRGFHRQVTFIVKSFFFTFMGAMLGPPWPMVLLGVLLGFVLLAARIPGVWLALVGSKLSSAERRLVLVSMPRGMAAGVLATMPAAAGIVGTDDLPNAVFAAALVSILIFAVGFPQARKGMEAAVPAGGGEPPFPPPVAEPPAAALVPAAGPAPEEPAPAPPVAVEPAPPGDPVPPPAESSPVEPERGPVPPEGPPPAPWS